LVFPEEFRTIGLIVLGLSQNNKTFSCVPDFFKITKYQNIRHRLRKCAFEGIINENLALWQRFSVMINSLWMFRGPAFD